MASINIITPRYGTITVVDSSISHYTVRYNPPAEHVEFHGFKVFCNACHQYLYTSTSNPSTFDISHLESTGHPGPFDISADTSAEVEYLVTTRPDNPIMGTTTPTEQWFTAEVGGTITFTIKATPKDGYSFEKWVSSTGAEFTSAKVTLSKTLQYGTDSAEYVAYFKKKTYKAYVTIKSRDTVGDVCLRVDNSGIHLTGNPRKVRVYDKSIRQEVDVAELYNNYSDVATEDRVTFNLVMLPAASTYGVRFMGFAVVSGTHEDGSFVEGGNSVTVTCDGTGIVEVEAWFSLTSVVVTLKIRNHEYGNLSASDVYNSYLAIDGSVSTSRITALKADFENGEFKWAVPAPTGDMYERHLYIEWSRYITNPMAFLHGTSSDRCQIGHWPASAYSRIKIVQGTQDETFYIYLCTHLLVHKPDGQNLESKPPELLYDCNMPEHSQQS